MPILLFTGPGGAGTTTLATAAAVRAAQGGRRAVLLTRQPAAATGLTEVGGLRVAEVRPQEALQGWWERHLLAVAGALPLLAVPPAESVVALPGMTELAIVGELARWTGDADVDDIVVDAGPLASAVALLGLPAALRWWLGRLLPARLRVLGALRTAMLEPESPARAPAEGLLAGVPALERTLGSLRLSDPAATAVVLVVPPRPSIVPELRTALTALGLHGQRPAALAVRMLPAEAGPWWAARLAEQETAAAALGALAPVLPVPELAVPPADADTVAGLAVELPEVPAVGAQPEPEPTGKGWQLALPVPFAERGTVDLTRWDDDLVLTAAGTRRSFPLDALLRRCVVTGAGLSAPGTAAARLEVAFAPDPSQWPADLLRSHQRGAEEQSASETTAEEGS